MATFNRKRIMTTTNADTACTIDHDGNLANGLQIGSGVHVAGDVTYGERSLGGAGVTVTTDVSDGVTVAGVPASPLQL